MCGQTLMPTEKLGEKEFTFSILTYKQDNTLEEFNSNYFLLLVSIKIKIGFFNYRTYRTNTIFKKVFLPCFIRNAFWGIIFFLFLTFQRQKSAFFPWKVIATVFKHDTIDYDLSAWIFTCMLFTTSKLLPKSIQWDSTHSLLFLCSYGL